MHMTRIESGVMMFVGDSHESVATAFLHDTDVLLVDALATRADAERMQDCLVTKTGKTVRIIVATHYMSHHMAGMRLYPKAQIVAQRHFLYTFESQQARSPQTFDEYVHPTVIFGDQLSLEWGRTPQPCKTMCSINIDELSCDAVFAADNIVYLSSSSPIQIDQAIDRLQQFQRGCVIGGHMGCLATQPWATRASTCAACAKRLSRFTEGIQGRVPTAFEREWHDRNLEVILERSTFARAAHRENYDAPPLPYPTETMDHE